MAGLRQSGDIDVWLDCKREQLYAFSKKELGKVEGITYHHIHYPKWTYVEVEAHIHPSSLSSPRRNKALKEFCEMHMPKFNEKSQTPYTLSLNMLCLVWPLIGYISCCIATGIFVGMVSG